MIIEREIARRTTAIVATYERPNHLDTLIHSFRSSYPGLPFVVADNSVNKYPRNDVDYLKIEAGSGISISRNQALSRVTSEFTLLVDDDHICLPETRIDRMIDFLLKNNIDLIAGRTIETRSEQFDFYGCYQFDRNTIYHYIGVASVQHAQWEQFDVTPNFFVARTAMLKQIAWDPNLRFAKEHDDFFLRAREANFKVSYLPDVSLLNNSAVCHHGGSKGAHCEEYFFDKWQAVDKIEVRWIRAPFPRLSFYSTRFKASIEPTKDQFKDAYKMFENMYPDFEVLDPFEC